MIVWVFSILHSTPPKKNYPFYEQNWFPTKRPIRGSSLFFHINSFVVHDNVVIKMWFQQIPWLVVSNLWKNESQLGLLLPIYGKKNHVPNHQSGFQLKYLILYESCMLPCCPWPWGPVIQWRSTLCFRWDRPASCCKQSRQSPEWCHLSGKSSNII